MEVSAALEFLRQYVKQQNPRAQKDPKAAKIMRTVPIGTSASSAYETLKFLKSSVPLNMSIFAYLSNYRYYLSRNTSYR